LTILATAGAAKMSAEDQLVQRITRAIGLRGGETARGGGRRVRGADRAGGVRLGLGDDATVIRPRTGKAELVLSCDAFLEGVHFLANAQPAYSVGYKALARATSDLAAMGATPRWFLLTLALPESRTGKWLDQFLGGLAIAARQLRMALIGGDTTKSGAIFVSITVIGEIAPGQAVTRAGARPGNRIYVSGTLGAAQLGLLMVKNPAIWRKLADFSAADSAAIVHLCPRVRVDLGVFLAQHRLASAMIDISDGLSTDLGRLCAASRVGARIWAPRIPCVQVPAGQAGKGSDPLSQLRLDALELALDGGEDYELLFTVSPKNENRLRQAPGFAELRQIGEIVHGRGITLIDKSGRAKRLVSGGWDPFKNPLQEMGTLRRG
jgi:thiamine-monophosphate kinase